MNEEFADNSVIGSDEWKRSADGGELDAGIDTRLQDGDELEDGKLIVHSLSGKERNHRGHNHWPYAPLSATTCSVLPPF